MNEFSKLFSEYKVLREAIQDKLDAIYEKGTAAARVVAIEINRCEGVGSVAYSTVEEMMEIIWFDGKTAKLRFHVNEIYQDEPVKLSWWSHGKYASVKLDDMSKIPEFVESIKRKLN